MQKRTVEVRLFAVRYDHYGHWLKRQNGPEIVVSDRDPQRDERESNV